MVRCQRYLEIIEEEKLVETSAKVGAHVLAQLHKLQSEMPDVFSNARGRGLMCSVDLPDTDFRNRTIDKAYELGLMVLGCGHVSLRFRPPLDITTPEVDEAVDLMRRAVGALRAKSA
jgi:L-lysine 6-transaminase